jgi:hypothetical protein
MTGSTGCVLVDASNNEAEYKLGIFIGFPFSIFKFT